MSESTLAPLAPAPRLLRVLNRPAFWIGLVLLLAAYPVSRAVHARMAPPPPVLVTLPAFQFVSQDARPFGSAQLAGHAYVADFVFTRCPTICPLITDRMKKLETRTHGLGSSLRLVSFSVDPEFDTPARLTNYAQKHHADLSRWSFLTGDVEPMKSTIIQGFKIQLGHEGAEDDFLTLFHGSQLVLVDGKGQVRGYYDSQDAEAFEKLVKDADVLVSREG